MVEWRPWRWVEWRPWRWVDWLPEDADHPIRPDLPWFRHLTFSEGHAVEIGIGLGALLYVAAGLDVLMAVFPIALFVIRIALGMRAKNDAGKEVAHNLGLHDLRSDPWYFVIPCLATIGALMIVFGVPDVTAFETVGGLF